MPDGSNNDIAEVSDEDESAEANESVQQEKKKKGSKLKLSAMFSAIVGMKSVHFKTTDDVPKGINVCKTERNQLICISENSYLCLLNILTVGILMIRKNNVGIRISN